MTTSTVDQLSQRDPTSITASAADARPRSTAGRPRAIGPAGTVARILLGGYLVGSVIEAEITDGFTPLLWALGLLAFPGVLLAAQWVRARRGGGRLHATGPVAHLVTVAGFIALTFIPEYNRAIDVAGAKALGDPTRLAIALALLDCERACVCDLGWITGRDEKLVSHHLRQLKGAGLARSERDGKMVMYELTSRGRILLEAVATQELAP